jgi:hypothetical protein
MLEWQPLEAKTFRRIPRWPASAMAPFPTEFSHGSPLPLPKHRRPRAGLAFAIALAGKARSRLGEVVVRGGRKRSVARSAERALIGCFLAAWLSLGPARPVEAEIPQGEWSEPSNPWATSFPLAVHDTKRDRMIVLTLIDSRVWAVDLAGAAHWTPIAGLGTPEPDDASLGPAIYDPVRDRVLIYGFNNFWELDLSGTPKWRMFHTAQPAAPSRFDGTAIYDPVRDRMVIFGGYWGSARHADVWALNLGAGNTWTRLYDDQLGHIPPPNGPSPRAGAAATYDAGLDRMVVFGGDGQQDAWAFRLTTNTWTTMTSSGPGPRDHHTIAYDASGDRFFLFGGKYPLDSGDLDAWMLPRGGSWTKLAPSGAAPIQRARHATILDATHQRALLFGGLDSASGEYNDLWQLSLSPTAAWSPTIAAPSPREGSVAIADPSRSRLILFGGTRRTSPNTQSHVVTLGDAWSLSLPTGEWSAIEAADPPAPRAFHSAVCDAAGDRMLVWGGHDTDVDVWSLDLAPPGTWSVLAVAGTPPGARSSQATVFDPLRRRMLVFGGASGSPPYYHNDLWALDLSGTPEWIPLAPSGTPPSAREGAVMVYDPTFDRVLLFGGHNWDGYHNDTWSLSLAGGGEWTPLAIASPPPPRAWSSAIYDPGRLSFVVFGGDVGVNNEDNGVWRWVVNGMDPWRKLSPAGPTPVAVRGSTAIAEPDENRMLVFGGRSYALPYGPESWSNVFTRISWGASPLDVPETPRGLRALAAFPNPARGATTLRFDLAAAGPCRLEVFDVAGHRIAMPVNRRLEPGTHEARWNARAAAGGVYFARLTTSGSVETRRVVVLESEPSRP